MKAPTQTAKLSITHNGSDLSIVATGRPVYIGPFDEFDGEIDELHIHDADTEAEIPVADIAEMELAIIADELDAEYCYQVNS